MATKLPIQNPPAAAVLRGGTTDGELVARIREALDRIRPAVQLDGGDVEFVDVTGLTARVRFRGACVGCPSADLTLRMGIERAIKESAPEITSVVAIM